MLCSRPKYNIQNSTVPSAPPKGCTALRNELKTNQKNNNKAKGIFQLNEIVLITKLFCYSEISDSI